MQQYSKAVTEYSDVVDTADKSTKGELKEILDSYKAKWTNMKIEMGSEITPQALNTLDQEYQEILRVRP